MPAEAGDDHLAHHLAVVDDEDFGQADSRRRTAIDRRDGDRVGQERATHSLNTSHLSVFAAPRAASVDATVHEPYTQTQMPTAPPARRTVWVVDDSPVDAERARRALEGVYSVEIFLDGAAALERLSAGRATGRARVRLGDARGVGPRGGALPARVARGRSPRSRCCCSPAQARQRPGGRGAVGGGERLRLEAVRRGRAQGPGREPDARAGAARARRAGGGDGEPAARRRARRAPRGRRRREGDLRERRGAPDVRARRRRRSSAAPCASSCPSWRRRPSCPPRARG